MEKIGHRARLRDTTGRTYPIYASTGHARYFIGSRYISVAKSKGFKGFPFDEFFFISPIFNGITCIPKLFDKKYRLTIVLV